MVRKLCSLFPTLQSNISLSLKVALLLLLLLSCFSRVRLQRPHGLQPTRLLHPWDFPGKSTGVGCHCLLRNYVPESSKKVRNPMYLLYVWERQPAMYQIFISLPLGLILIECHLPPCFPAQQNKKCIPCKQWFPISKVRSLSIDIILHCKPYNEKSKGKYGKKIVFPFSYIVE